MQSQGLSRDSSKDFDATDEDVPTEHSSSDNIDTHSSDVSQKSLSAPTTTSSISSYDDDKQLIPGFSKSTPPQMSTLYSISSPQDTYLQFIHPTPTCPPSYDIQPPGGCPRFPVTDSPCGNEVLPAYAPAAYKIGICHRKQEWLSPYEISPSRSWKAVIIELNSTQLNMYSVPSSLEPSLQGLSHSLLESQCTKLSRLTWTKSLVTTDLDLHFFKLCDEARIINSSLTFLAAGRTDQTNLDTKTRSHQMGSSKKLLRSYSLQHARFGLANDYTKKPHVMRLRLENEQLLLSFASANDLIDWNFALSIGRDVSLDLRVREAPKYRTVPRRRRNTIARETPFFNEVITRRLRAKSEPQRVLQDALLRGKLSRLKSKFGSSSNLNMSRDFLTNERQHTQHLTPDIIESIQVSQPTSKRPSIEVNRSIDDNDSNKRENSPRQESINNRSHQSGSQTQRNYQESHYLPEETSADLGDEDEEDDVRNISDIHRSDDDEDYGTDIEDFGYDDPREVLTGPISNTVPLNSNEGKWDPGTRIESNRRYMRNCLKCIGSLSFDDSWSNKVLVKPTGATPLTMLYHKFLLSDESMSKSSSVSLLQSYCNDSDWQLPVDISSSRRKQNLAKELSKSYLSTQLSRVPHHNLREFVVGSHSLIPKAL